MAKAPFSKHHLPMLASTAPRPFNEPEWQFEVKCDRYRMLAFYSLGNTEIKMLNQVFGNNIESEADVTV